MHVGSVIRHGQRPLRNLLGDGTLGGRCRRARLSERDTGSEPSVDLQIMLTKLRRVFGGEGDRCPDVLTAARHIERGRHDTDDHVRSTVDLDDAIERTALAVEMTHPQPITDDGDVRETASSAKLPQRKPNVLAQLVTKFGARRLAIALPAITATCGVDRCAVAEATLRLEAGIRARHAELHQLANGHLEVESE